MIYLQNVTTSEEYLDKEYLLLHYSLPLLLLPPAPHYLYYVIHCLYSTTSSVQFQITKLL